jgi:predicted GNAT family acetyltransferase
MSIVEPAYSAGRFDGTLAAALRDIVASQHTVQYAGHSLLFIPAVEASASASDTLPDRAVVRPITPQEKPSNVPEQSVEAGTAFGIFMDDILVSWAEATPLPTVTSRFGVMLVGIETAEGFRQRGFARAGLTALTVRVISMGRVPLYSCAQHNVASQRTALSCGYRLYGESIRVQALPPPQADGRQSSA